MSKFILLTGGTGFIGSQLAENLLNHDKNIILLKRSYSDIWRIENFINSQNKKNNFNIIDIDKIVISDIFDNYDIEGILHLATYYTKFHKPHDISHLFDSNIKFPTETLENTANNSVKYFINTGTFFEYNLNENNNNLIDEESQIHSFNLYDNTKLSFENFLKYYNNEYGIKTATLKLFTPYCPKDDVNKFIPYLIINLLNKNRIQLNDLHNMLDLIFVDDIIDSYFKTIKNIYKFDNYEVFNIGSGITYSIKEIYRIIYNIINKTLEEKGNNINKNNDFNSFSQEGNCAGIDKAKDVVNVGPKTSLEEGLK